GMVESARKGYKNRCSSTFGYKNVHVYDENNYQRTKYEINDSEAATVRLIFDLYTKGHGLKNIVIYLNTHGYKPRSGGKWGTSTVANILRNESYIGCTVFNKRDKKTYGKQFKPKDQWLVVKNTHEPIVEKEVFDKAQRLIEERRPKNQPARVTASSYLLSGLMQCGKCKKAYGVTGYGRNRKYAYYNCLTYSKQGKDTCPGRRLRADEVDAEIIQRIKELLFSDENMKKLADDINQATKSLRTDYWRKIMSLKKKASDLQNRIMRQYAAIESGVIDLNLVAPRLKELKAQKESLQKEITHYETLNSRHQPVNITRVMVAKFRKEMEEVFVGNSIQVKREFLKKFIDKIVINEDGIEIVYYAPGLKFPSLDLPTV
ncbi:MAG: recombinase family protein, partial [Candidatus Omnitrophica bacterium]|nr:recombinase family protein [Candidatus Omnitrophota bacterium]